MTDVGGMDTRRRLCEIRLDGDRNGLPSATILMIQVELWTPLLPTVLLLTDGYGMLAIRTTVLKMVSKTREGKVGQSIRKKPRLSFEMA